MTATIPHAATVLLLRQEDARLQVLLAKRAPGLSFMGGLWVFPGGRMEASDLSPELAARSDQAAIADTGSRMLSADASTASIDLDVARGLLIAACRETFEESGVLLARPRGGGPWGDERRARVAERRAADSADATGFARMLVDEDLVLDIERLVYWSHWITPAFESRRFDTRFFALTVPADQEASVDRGELTHHAWLAEADIRRHLASGEMKMAPPTRATLLDLWSSHRRHGGLAAMLEAERTRIVPPILPKLVESGAADVEIVLPWDEQYRQMPGEGCRTLACYPDYVTAMPSRMRFPRLS
ncbi:MAG: NUDIX domain-containing protein [Steroidobacteraceae bacterium]|nr:NUDIX domain-containing protein [Steroidobacteraceae bacterium]MBP7013077.1 NUDIX domain-containing protein [Steroidobacteraceae bacterium]